MNISKIGLAVQNGVSIVCATCKRYWEARDKGLPEPQCASSKRCAGPFAGMEFPEYDGPITDFSQWCFVCGADADYGLQSRGSGRVFGICSEHVVMVQEKPEPMGLGHNGVPIIDVLTTEGRLTQEQFFGVPRKTLGQVIAEVESYYAEKEGREG